MGADNSLTSVKPTNSQSEEEHCEIVLRISQPRAHIIDCGCWTGNQRNFGIVYGDEIAVYKVNTESTSGTVTPRSKIYVPVFSESTPRLDTLIARLISVSGLSIERIKSAKLKPWFSNETDDDYYATLLQYEQAILFIPDTHIGMMDNADDFFNDGVIAQRFLPPVEGGSSVPRIPAIYNYLCLDKLLSSAKEIGVKKIVQLGDYLDIWEAEASVFINDIIAENFYNYKHFYRSQFHEQIIKLPHYHDTYLRKDYLVVPPMEVVNYVSMDLQKSIAMQIDRNKQIVNKDLSFRAFVSIHSAWGRIGGLKFQEQFSLRLKGNHDHDIPDGEELVFMGKNSRVRIEHGHRFDGSNSTYKNPDALNDITPKKNLPRGIGGTEGRAETWDCVLAELTRNPNYENGWFQSLAWRQNVVLIREHMMNHMIGAVPQPRDSNCTTTKRKAALMSLPRVWVIGHTHFPDIFAVPV